MTKYMKKNSLGILVESEDQHINSDTVEIRLTISEYKNLLDQMMLGSKGIFAINCINCFQNNS